MPKSASGSHHAEAGRTGRKLVEIAQVARGRTPLKYEFEVIPFFAGEQHLSEKRLVKIRRQLLLIAPSRHVDH
jgi:hypothetical protein